MNNNLKKTEDILFYTATRVNPSKEGLERILEKVPVTNYRNPRYNNIMGLKFAIPVGIIILVLMVFFAAGKKPSQPQTITVLPASVTKENVDSSLNQVDSALSESQSQMDKDLKEIDQEDTQQGSKDGSGQEGSSDDLNDL